MSKKVPKGVQVVIASDHICCRPRAHFHRHKLYYYPKDLMRVGTCELHHLASLMLKKVIDHAIPTINDGKKKIFRKKMGFTVDNFFICDKGLDWASKASTGMMCANARNCIPKEIETHFLQVKKNATGKSVR